MLDFSNASASSAETKRCAQHEETCEGGSQGRHAPTDGRAGLESGRRPRGLKRGQGCDACASAGAHLTVALSTFVLVACEGLLPFLDDESICNEEQGHSGVS